MDDDDRAIIERELADPKSQAYWKSPDFAARWHELMYRLDNETMTVEEAAQFLRVPTAVFEKLYAHRLALDAVGMSEADFKHHWDEYQLREGKRPN